MRGFICCGINCYGGAQHQRRPTGVHHYRRQQRRLWLHVNIRALNLQTMLRFMMGLLLIGYVFDVAICLAAPCPFFEIGSKRAVQAGQCVEEYELVLTVRMVGYTVCLIGAGYLICAKIFRIVQFSKNSGCCSRVTTSGGAVDSSWVCAASPDLYHETLNSLRASNTLLALSTLPFGLLLVATYKSIGVEETLEETHPLIDEICGSSKACSLGKHWNELLQRAVLGIWGAGTIQFLTTPSGLWGGVMTCALRQKGSPLIGCLRRTPYFIVVSFILVFYQNLHREMRDVPNTADAGPDVGVLFCIQVVSLLFHLVHLWSSRLVHDMMTFLSSAIRVTYRKAVASKFRRTLSKPIEFALFRKVSKPAHLQRAPTAIKIMHESSAGHRQELLMMVFALVLCYRVVSGVPVVLAVVIYALRVTLACLILLLREKECDFGGLEGSPGFGLVVQASALHAALQCAVRGNPYRGGLPRYKATAERMEDTLAVSYRWQVEELTLSPDCVLNMSRFQVEELARAIKKQGCQYVWLDRLSVPQYECDLKYTLLARMMAVYAAASATVAFRSLESPGSRYHERVWTCQEYCMARRLQVVTEDDEDDGFAREDGVMAVMAEEEAEVNGLRERVQLDGGSVLPLWLRRSPIPPEEAKEVVRSYSKLSTRLQCREAADKVRALVPLLARAPVEGQSELVQLVLQLGQSSGEDLQQWKGDLLEQHLAHKRGTFGVLHGSIGSHWCDTNINEHHAGPSLSRMRTLRRSLSLVNSSLHSTAMRMSEDGTRCGSNTAPFVTEEPRPWRPSPRRASSSTSICAERYSWDGVQGLSRPESLSFTACNNFQFSHSAPRLPRLTNAGEAHLQRMRTMVEEVDGASSVWESRALGSDALEPEHHLPVTNPTFEDAFAQSVALPGAVVSKLE